MGSTVRLHGLNLISGDVDAAVAFYRALGVDIPDSGIWSTSSGAHHVTADDPSDVDLEIDSVALAGRYNESARSEDPAGSTLLGFAVDTRDQVDATHSRLVALGYRSLQEPLDAFWGSRHAIVADPDGRQVGIMSPADPSRRGEPPAI